MALVSKLFRSLTGILGLAAALSVAPAQADVPAAKRISATLVSPASVSASYSASSTHTTGPGSFTATPPEIKALARSLGGERYVAGQITADQFAQNVYDYVRNSIETEFRFGLAKGGRGALIDESGTPFDAAELMVKLIRQGGSAAGYQVGTVTLTAQEFGLWTGFVKNLNPSTQAFDVDAKAACQLLADGGIPATVNGATDCSTVSGNLSTVTMAHIWVISNGKLYDPSFKHHRFKTSIDLPAAMQCGTASAPTCGSGAVTAVMSGASQTTNGSTGVSTITGANGAGVANQVSTYAQNLQHAIETSNPTGQLDDIIGGKEVDTSFAPTGGSGLPYAASTPASTWTTIAGDIPDAFRSTLRFQYNGMDTTFYSDEVSTQRLRVFANGVTNNTGHSELYAEDTLIQSVTLANNFSIPAPPGVPTIFFQGSGTVTLTVTHPYARTSGTYGNDAFTLRAIEPFFILQGWGASSASTQSYFATLQSADPSPFHGSSTANIYSCNGNNFPSTGWCRADEQPTEAAMYLSQRSLSDAIVAATSSSAITTHHVVGLIAGTQVDPYSASYYTLDARSSVSVNSSKGTAADAATAFETASISASGIEGSVGQQTQDTPQIMSGVGYLAQTGNFTYVPSAQITSNFSSIIADPNNLRGPTLQAAATLGLDVVSGGALYIGQPVDVFIGGGHADYVVNGTYKGAGNPEQPDPVGAVLKTVQSSDVGVRKKSAASISIATGAMTFTAPPDLVTGAGEFPFSLSFQRTYQSDAGSYEDVSRLAYGANWSVRGPDQDAGAYLGAGWTHNWDIFARLGSDGPRALGRNSALEASGAVAAIVTAENLLSSPNFQQRVAAVFTSNWMTTQFANNAVTVSRLPHQEVFTRLPDGRYAPPLGSSSKLTVSGTPTAIRDPNNGWLGYDYSSYSINYYGSGGDTIAFTVASKVTRCVSDGVGGETLTQAGLRQFVPTSWAFPAGPLVSFNYAQYVQQGGTQQLCMIGAPTPSWSTQSYLTSVTNSLGRSLTFATTAITAYPAGQVSGYPQNAGPGVKITKVTDENSRHADFAISGCGPIYMNNGTSTGGVQATGQDASGNPVPLSYAFACPTFTATAPDGGVTKYTYGAAADSPDPAWATKPAYHLRRWYTPTNQTTPYEVFAYDDAYRVATATDILSHQTKYYPGGLAEEAYKPGQTVDPLGNVSLAVFDQWNSGVKNVDPLGRTVTTAYDSAHRPVLKTNPEGDSVATVYDPRSNVLSVTQHAKPGSGIADKTTSTTYTETGLVCSNLITCDKPLTNTDALGRVTNYSWDAYGNLTQVLKPKDGAGLRPQIDLTYDSSNPWMLLTKTEKVDASHSVVTSYTYNSANKYVLSTATVDSGSGGLALRTCFNFDAVGNLLSTSDPRATTCP